MSVELFFIPILFIGAVNADILPNMTICGNQVEMDTVPLIRIKGGNETYYGEFPWLAALHYINKYSGVPAGIRCGGFVISKRFVATTAYCLHIPNYKLDEVWLGVRKISQIETTDVNSARKFKVIQKIIHEEYDHVIRVNDIALLKLDKDIKFTNYISPICLPDENAPVPETGTLVMIAGWGRPLPRGSLVDHKLKVDVPVFKHDVCEEMLGYQIRSTQICAEGETLKGSCWGDEGGPVMLNVPFGIEKRWLSIGIISTTNACNVDGKPSIHTRVSSFVPWITEKVERT